MEERKRNTTFGASPSLVKRARLSPQIASNEKKSETTFENLPEELQIHIFGYLSIKNLRSLALVCHDWKRLTEDRKLWMWKFKEDFPPSLFLSDILSASDHIEEGIPLEQLALNINWKWLFYQEHLNEILDKRILNLAKKTGLNSLHYHLWRMHQLEDQFGKNRQTRIELKEGVETTLRRILPDFIRSNIAINALHLISSDYRARLAIAQQISYSARLSNSTSVSKPKILVSDWKAEKLIRLFELKDVDDWTKYFCFSVEGRNQLCCVIINPTRLFFFVSRDEAIL
jgi:hypothetical protein